ncbi:hypothetical protein [Paracoccus sp. APAP_BH8]
MTDALMTNFHLPKSSRWRGRPRR